MNDPMAIMNDETLFELSIEKLIDAPVAAVWKAYTDHLADWWTPRPWTTEIVAQDMQPGGRSALIMYGTNGEEHLMEGIYLEVVPERKIVFTDAYHVGWIPQRPFFTGILTFEPEGDRTRYRAAARHWNAQEKQQHQEMGFEEGWKQVADQLEEVAKRIA